MEEKDEKKVKFQHENFERWLEKEIAGYTAEFEKVQELHLDALANKYYYYLRILDRCQKKYENCKRGERRRNGGNGHGGSKATEKMQVL